jgi:lipopolysaccharide/colanic/teichoic acid biosynthesis glycosyltransferase
VSNLFSKLSKIKKNIIIVNPGLLSLAFTNDFSFLGKYKILFVNLNKDDLKDSEIKFKNCESIFIDDLDSVNTSDDYLLLINHYRVFDNKIITISDAYEQYFHRIPIVKFKGSWIAPKELVGISVSKHIEFTKRLFDLLIIFLFSPFILFFVLLGMIVVMLSSKGPIFFKQERVGKNGKPFVLYKLRTMVHNDTGHTSFTKFNDERIFPAGKFLRISKIDELPQCLNVLKGDMSIIGPRPEKTEIVNQLKNENPFYELRHLIRPGITGWAQVNNPVATPSQNFEKLEYDLFYIKKANLILEISIIIKTINIILKRNSL